MPGPTRTDMQRSAERISQRMAEIQARDAGEAPPPAQVPEQALASPQEIAQQAMDTMPEPTVGATLDFSQPGPRIGLPPGEDSDEQPQVEGQDEVVDVEQPEVTAADEQAPVESQWGSLDELLEAGAVSPDNLKVQVKVDGEMVETTLLEALNGYQRTAANTRAWQEAAEQKRKYAELMEAALTDAQTRVDLFEANASHEEQAIENDRKQLREWSKNIDWNGLQQDDQAFATTNARFEIARRNLDDRETSLKERRAAVQKAYEDAANSAAQERRSAEQELLLRMDGWSSNTAEKQVEDLSNYLRQAYKVDSHNITHTTERAWLWDVVRKAQAYDAALARGTKVADKAKRGVLRPGTSKTVQEQSAAMGQVGLQRQREELKKHRRTRKGQEIGVDLLRQRLENAQNGRSS